MIFSNSGSTKEKGKKKGEIQFTTKIDDFLSPPKSPHPPPSLLFS
jgi:hypothetical protein